jgi:hypothetical protein
VAFTDTICRSCAERVRIEGLWASAPPTPVWPGSAQTAALFVGLPLLIALVLMAAPLHDPGPPPRVEERTAAWTADAPAEPPADTPAAEDSAAVASFPARHAAVSRPRRAAVEPVPAVIFVSRRTLATQRQPAGDVRATPAAAPSASVSWLRRELARECNCAVTLTSAAARSELRPAAATESP